MVVVVRDNVALRCRMIMSNSLVVIPAGLPAAARCWLTVFFNFHCTIGNLKLSLGFQVMKSTSLVSWSSAEASSIEMCVVAMNGQLTRSG